MLRLLAVAGIAAALAAPAQARTSLVRGNDGPWLAYGHDDQLSNAVVSRILDSQTVPRLAQRWDASLDALVTASPLYAEPLVDGVRTGVVYVATEAGSSAATIHPSAVVRSPWKRRPADDSERSIAGRASFAILKRRAM